MRATVVDGHHTGRHWVAHLNCDHRQQHDRRPMLSEVVACQSCTDAYALIPAEIARIEARMIRLAQSKASSNG